MGLVKQGVVNRKQAMLWRDTCYDRGLFMGAAFVFIHSHALWTGLRGYVLTHFPPCDHDSGVSHTGSAVFYFILLVSSYTLFNQHCSLIIILTCAGAMLTGTSVREWFSLSWCTPDFRWSLFVHLFAYSV